MEINSKLLQLEKDLEQVEKDKKEAEVEASFYQVLKEYRGEDEVISFKNYQEIIEKRGQLKTFKTGFFKIDTLIDGFHEGDLVVLTGASGEGKTSLAMTFTKMFSDSGIRSLWFSYEMPIGQFLVKFGSDLPDGYLPKTLINRNIIWIERKIVEGLVKFKTKIVFIDHLHYLFDLRISRNPSLEIGDLMRQLKLIAKKYNVIIVLIAHITKVQSDQRISKDSIRDSGMIVQESDYVLAIWRVMEKKSRRIKKSELEEGISLFKNEAMVSVEKNRYTGRLGFVKLYYKDNYFYEEPEQVPSEQI